MLLKHGVLGATFIIARAMQAASMIAIIGLTANFIQEMISANGVPPPVLVGTLSIVCIAALYCGITVMLFLDSLLPFFIATVIDAAFMVALTVVAVVVGRPLSYLNCTIIGTLNSYPSSYTSAYNNNNNDDDDASTFAAALTDSITTAGKVIYSNWIGTSRATCLEMKSIWGLSIALCVLFFLTSVCTVSLWKRARQVASGEKGEA